MDHSSCEEDDEDCAYVPRATGQLSFKKVKRTRMNVDHLTDEEKRLRKRFLGRERARRYRERKRATESSFEPQRVDRYVARVIKPRGVGRPKGSRRKKKRRTLLMPLSKVFTRRLAQAEGLPTDKSYPALASTQKVNHHHSLEEPTCSVPLRDPCTSQMRSLTVEDIDQLSDACASIPTQVPGIGTGNIIADVGANAIRGGLDVESQDNREAAESQNNILSEDLASSDASSEQLACRKMEARVSIVEYKDTRDDDCLETLDSSTNTASASSCSSSDTKTRNTDPKNLSDNGQNGLSGAPPKQTKKTFKQQNVKDFINFFPVDNSGSLDAKSFVIGSCSMQRKIEYVPPVKRLAVSKLSPCEPTLQTPTDRGDDMNKEGSSNAGEDNEKDTAPPEPFESQNVTKDLSPKTKVDEKQPVAASVESSLQQTSPPTSQASLSSVLPVGNLPMPLVLDSTSTQPLAVVGLPLQQTLQDVQLSGLLQQQQLINAAAANIQALNNVDTAGQSNIAGAQDSPNYKGFASLQGIVGLQNLQGLGGNQGISGIQGFVGTSSCFGLQGVIDPRLASLAGLQGIGVLQNMTSLQGHFGGLHGISGIQGGLQGIAGLQGGGCLQGITGPISPTGFVGLQNIQNLQGVSGLQGVTGLQAVPGLQGLVSLPGLSVLPGVQCLQGVGIVDPHADQGLQAVSALQGNAYLHSITGVQGTPGLVSELPSQPGVFGQPGLSDITGAVIKLKKQDVTGQDMKNQRLASSTRFEGVAADLKKVQPCKTAGEDIGEQSSQTDTSTPTEPTSISHDALLFTPEKLKCRSRRKQASPRCISKQQRLSFDSKDDTEEEGDGSQEETTASAPNKTQELKTLGPEIVSTSQTEIAVLRSSVQAKMEPARPGTKLSKKVEELISATKPHQLGVDCPSSDPVDDESPSPQTWRRFLERERQRNDRLKEVEEQLARLQTTSFCVQTAGCRALGPKSFVSMATQTDSEELPGNCDRGDERILRQRENFGQMLRNAEGVTGQAGGSGIMHGQIQQGVVTSSGDSLVRNLSSDVNKNEDETTKTLPLLAEDIPCVQNEMPLLACGDTGTLMPLIIETKIMNRPSNIWLHSYKKKRKVSRMSVKTLKPHLAEVSDREHKRLLNEEELNNKELISSSPKYSQVLSPKQKKTKYVYQIPLNAIDEAASVRQTGEVPGAVNNNGLGHNLENPISLPGRIGDIIPSLSSVQQTQGSLMAQAHPVLPWEVHGLSKIERNRIRAREGMRKHREKLRQAKLVSQTWVRTSLAPEVSARTEATTLVREPGMFDVPSFLSVKVPNNLNTITIPSRNDVMETAQYNLQSDLTAIHVGSARKQKSTAGTHSASAKALLGDSLLTGQDLSKKPFDVLTRVAVDVVSTANIKPETMDLPLTHEMEDSKSTKLKLSTSGDFMPAQIERSHVMCTSETDRIDFTQEPYRSMSLQERNRIRAREGMRRYRERMKLARLSPPQLPRISFVKPHKSRAARKRGAARVLQEGISTSDGTKVAASEHLVELAKRHTKNASSLPSYSEMLQHDRAEAVKRRRAVALLRSSGRRPRPKTSRPTDKQLLKTLEIDSNGTQDSTSLPSSAESLKSGRIMFIKSELFQDGNSGQTESGPKLGQVKYWSTTRMRDHTKSETPSAHPTELPVATSISDELPKRAERKRLKSEKKTKGHPDVALRKRYIDEKVACGMDRYAAVSTSAAAEKHAVDRRVATTLHEDKQATGDCEAPEKQTGVDERPH